MEERNPVLDSHVAYNRWQVMEGMRVSEHGTKPSIYITEIKFKKLFKTLNAEELQRIFKIKRNLSPLAIETYQKKLANKVEKITEDQILTALNLYLRHEDAELASEYIWSCQLPRKKKEYTALDEFKKH